MPRTDRASRLAASLLALTSCALGATCPLHDAAADVPRDTRHRDGSSSVAASSSSSAGGAIDARTLRTRDAVAAATAPPDATPVASAPAPAASPLEPTSTTPANEARWSGVAAAAQAADVLAVWGDLAVRLSRDGGARFGRALEDPAARRGRVSAVALAPGGALFVVRGDRWLGARSAAGRERWSRLPRACPDAQIAANDGALALYCAARPRDDRGVLLVSRDGGATFAQRALPADGNTAHDLRLEVDGTLYWWSSNEAPCGGGVQWRFRGHLDRDAWEPLPDPVDSPIESGMGANGWSYALERPLPNDPPWSLARETDDHAVSIEPSARDAWRLRVATNGRDTLAVEGARIMALDGATVRVLARGVPADLELHAVDARGRALGLRDGRVYRATPSGRSWRALHVVAQ